MIAEQLLFILILMGATGSGYIAAAIVAARIVGFAGDVAFKG